MNRLRILQFLFVVSVLMFIFVVIILSGDLFDTRTNTSTNNKLLTEIKIKNSQLKTGEIKLSKSYLAKSEVVIYNVGSNELIINQIEVSCNCTSGNMPKRSIPPGDSVSIDISYTKKLPGYFYSDVIVHGNFLNSPALLTFEGRLIE